MTDALTVDRCRTNLARSLSPLVHLAADLSMVLMIAIISLVFSRGYAFAGTLAAPSQKSPGPAIIVVVHGTLWSDNALGTLPTASVPFSINTADPNPSATISYPEGVITVSCTGAGSSVSVTVNGELDFASLFGGDWLGMDASVDVYVKGCVMPYECSGQASGSVWVAHPEGCGAIGPHGMATFSSTSVGSASGCEDGTLNLAEALLGRSGLSAPTATCFPQYPGTAYSFAATYPLHAELYQAVGFNPFGGVRRIVCGVNGTFAVSAASVCAAPKALVVDLGGGLPAEDNLSVVIFAEELERLGWQVDIQTHDTWDGLCSVLGDPCVRGLAVNAHGFWHECGDGKSALMIAGMARPGNRFYPSDLVACRAGNPLEFILVNSCYTDAGDWTAGVPGSTFIGANLQFPRLFGNCAGSTSAFLENTVNAALRDRGWPVYPNLQGPCHGACGESMGSESQQTAKARKQPPQCLSFAVCDTSDLCGDDAFPPSDCSSFRDAVGSEAMVVSGSGGNYSCAVFWSGASGDSASVVASSFDRIPGTDAADEMRTVGKVLWVAGVADNGAAPDSVKITLNYQEHLLEPGTEGSLRILAGIQGTPAAEFVPVALDSVSNTISCTLPTWAIAAIVTPHDNLLVTGVPIVHGSGTWLQQNHPNPFNPTTTITFEIPVATIATLSIFDVAGRVVRHLVCESLPPGRHEITWDGRNDEGANVPSGVYFGRLEAGGVARTIKLGLLK
jgi:hypothetical protein